ncbi:Crp/Fnr family transcriptional regulator [Pleurocapsales cyanobacterium LEGE 10410]|nr:Crp/Fnr family transcriptional regulator [Pleurocapsales cyanobacterium LEGE 10410]
MQFSENLSEESRPILTWQNIIDWAQTHYRERIFLKDEQIPTRPQLIYLVNRGAVRLVSKAPNQPDLNSLNELEESEEQLDEAFLGFIGAGLPFEIVTESSFSIHAYAHVDRTQVAWLYWQDLENWPDFRQEIYEAFRYQHQRKLLWLSALGQRRTIDRLTSFLILLVQEYGTDQEQNCCLPYSLTHAQIGSAIGSTRVTVTRLMGKLRRQGIISIKNDNSICINGHSLDRGQADNR